MAVVLNRDDTNKLLAHANSINEINRRNGTNAPIYYREPGELLLIKNGQLLESYQIMEGKNNNLYTELTSITLDESDYKDEEKRPTKCLDFVNINDDQDIREYINDDGIAVWYKNSAYCIRIEEIVNMFNKNTEGKLPDEMNLDNVIFYRCISERPSPSPEKQYFLLRLGANYLVPLEDVRKMIRYNYQHGVKIFKIEPALEEGKQVKFEYTMSHEVATHFIDQLRFRQGGSAVSADHCQANSSKLLYRLYPVQSELNASRHLPTDRDDVKYQDQINTRLQEPRQDDDEPRPANLTMPQIMEALINDQIPDDWEDMSVVYDMLDANSNFSMEQLFAEINRILGERNLNDIALTDDVKDVIRRYLPYSLEDQDDLQFGMGEYITNESLAEFIVNAMGAANDEARQLREDRRFQEDPEHKGDPDEVPQMRMSQVMDALINNRIPPEWGPTTALDMINADQGFLIEDLLTTVNRLLGNRDLNELEHFDVISRIISEKIELMTIDDVVEFDELRNEITNDSLLAFVNDRVREAEEVLNE